MSRAEKIQELLRVFAYDIAGIGQLDDDTLRKVLSEDDCSPTMKQLGPAILAARASLSRAPESGGGTVDLDAEAWQQIKAAARASPWMPPEYMMNDWVSDLCHYLTNAAGPGRPEASGSGPKGNASNPAPAAPCKRSDCANECVFPESCPEGPMDEPRRGEPGYVAPAPSAPRAAKVLIADKDAGKALAAAPPAPSNAAGEPLRESLARFEVAPCYRCGYNGPGYYQPAVHSCARWYHDHIDLLNRNREDLATELAESRAHAQRLAERECHHGWRGTAPDNGRRIVTPCPECGNQSLFIGSGGHLTCARVPNDHGGGCPNPSVADVVKQLRQDRDRLAGELNGARADAERYRKLKANWGDAGICGVWTEAAIDQNLPALTASRHEGEK